MSNSQSQAENILHILDKNFETEVLHYAGLVVVDFWAEWCGPCKILGPTLAQIARENIGKIKVCKMDVDQNQETPAKFRIQGIPTLLFFKEGKLVEQIVGNLAQATIQEIIDRHAL